MGGYSNFYDGADYGFDSKYGEFLKMGYRSPLSSISVATDARTANQIKTTTEKLSTGAKAIEVQLTMPDVAESIPNQHLEELRRLKKLVGADFTMHGPLVEPTGVTRQGWDETHRQQAERQMWTALQRANLLKEKDEPGIVVTFHSSNGLPDPETRVINDSTGKEEVKELMIVDERNGQFSKITPKEDFLEKTKPDPYKELEKNNKENWDKILNQLSFHATRGRSAMLDKIKIGKEDEENIEKELKTKNFYELYNLSKTEEGQKAIENLDPEVKKVAKEIINTYNYGEIEVREAYSDLNKIFNQAYDSLRRKNNQKAKEDLKKLDKFANELEEKRKKLNFRDPRNIGELGEEVTRGVNLLNNIETPELARPLKEFAIEQASDTFSNLAVKAYKEFGSNAPIISIENPPAGSGLSRAEDLKELIDASRKKFAEKISHEKGLSEKEAEKEAEKLIGATWDVGHINMLKKFGYGDKALGEQTKILADKDKKYLKHVHLSDNFGMEHTELPMGMGNVPTKKHMDILDDYNKKLKKVIEVGNWYQHFQTTPLMETLAAFGSPVYSMQMAPYWNQVAGRLPGDYFSGYGFNPDVHHSIYGSGFSGLPVELGGNIQGRSRLSGAPIE